MLLTVLNVGRVLDLYDDEHPERGVKETGDLLGTSRSKAHALMTSMTSIGLLRRVDGGRYRLGWRALSLSQCVMATTDWRTPALQAANRLVHHFGETVHLATLDDGQVLYVDRLGAPDSLRLPTTTRGSRLPAHCSGVGKVLLAGLGEDETERAVSEHGLFPMTPATITDRGDLKQALDVVRDHGYACDRDEALVGVSCVAAPILDDKGRVTAAISVSAQTQRVRTRQADLCRAVVGAAGQVSRSLRSTGCGSSNSSTPADVGA